MFNNSSKVQILLTALVGVLCVILIIGSFYFWFATRSLIDTEDSYQAVFLSNGQVYFGNIVKENRSEIHMNNVYYLQVQQQLREESNENKGAAQPDLSLVKLGNELHAPKDAMFINRKHVLFVENLKDDSTVVKAIEEYKNR